MTGVSDEQALAAAHALLSDPDISDDEAAGAREVLRILGYRTDRAAMDGFHNMLAEVEAFGDPHVLSDQYGAHLGYGPEDYDSGDTLSAQGDHVPAGFQFYEQRDEDTRNCPNHCGAFMPADALYCRLCGALMGLSNTEYSVGSYDVVFCPSSGHMNTIDARFCDQCGSAMSQVYTAGHVSDGGKFPDDAATSSSGRRPAMNRDEFSPRERSRYLAGPDYNFREPDPEPEGTTSYRAEVWEERRDGYENELHELDRGDPLFDQVRARRDYASQRASQLLDEYYRGVEGIGGFADGGGKHGGMQDVMSHTPEEWRQRNAGLSAVDRDRNYR